MEGNHAEITKLDVNDAFLLSKIAIKAYSDHYLHLWHDGGKWYIETFLTADRLRAELQDANACFFLIHLNQEPVGFLELNLNKPVQGHNTKALELERIYLMKSASGKGIGTQVIQFTAALARQKSVNLIWLKVMDSSHEVISFYRKTGFEVCGTHRLSFEQMKTDLQGMLIMQKRLV